MVHSDSLVSSPAQISIRKCHIVASPPFEARLRDPSNIAFRNAQNHPYQWTTHKSSTLPCRQHNVELRVSLVGLEVRPRLGLLDVHAPVVIPFDSRNIRRVKTSEAAHRHICPADPFVIRGKCPRRRVIVIRHQNGGAPGLFLGRASASASVGKY